MFHDSTNARLKCRCVPSRAASLPQNNTRTMAELIRTATAVVSYTPDSFRESDRTEAAELARRSEVRIGCRSLTLRDDLHYFLDGDEHGSRTADQSSSWVSSDSSAMRVSSSTSHCLSTLKM